jgi:2-C-methyl-D-erythritol 4-phosphate cytidylyltransferase
LPKALVPVCRESLIRLTLRRFDGFGMASGAVVVVPPEHRAAFESELGDWTDTHGLRLVDGGAERQHSVANGLGALDEDTGIVVIHDAARPFVAEESVRGAVDAADAFGAATVALPTVDTILVGDADAFLVDTPDRATMWACQTPQVFRLEVIRRAHDAARSGGYLGTDDASLVRRLGEPVKLVKGTPFNFKITTPTDLHMAEWVIEKGLV